MIDLKTISGDRTNQKRQECQHDRVSEGIEQRPCKILICDQAFKVFDQISARIEPSGYNIRTLVGCTAEHIVQRKNGEQRYDGQKCILEKFLTFAHHRSSPTFI